jgi:hypothetical protein
MLFILNESCSNNNGVVGILLLRALLQSLRFSTLRQNTTYFQSPHILTINYRFPYYVTIPKVNRSTENASCIYTSRYVTIGSPGTCILNTCSWVIILCLCCRFWFRCILKHLAFTLFLLGQLLETSLYNQKDMSVPEFPFGAALGFGLI